MIWPFVQISKIKIKLIDSFKGAMYLTLYTKQLEKI